MTKNKNQQKKTKGKKTNRGPGNGPGSSGQAVRVAGGGAAVAAPRMRVAYKPNAGVTHSKVKQGKKQMVCSIYDPFCSHAEGAKYPDGLAARTITFRAVMQESFNTSANGSACFVFAPDPSAYAWLEGSGAASALLMSASYQNIMTDTFVTNNISQMRLVSAGVEFIPTLPATSAGATIITSTVNPSVAIQGTTITVPNYTYGNEVVVADGRAPFTWISRRADQMEAAELVSPLGNTTRSGAWTALCCQGLGPISSTLGYMVMVLNFEFTFKQTVAEFSALARPAPPADPHVLKATSILASQTSGLFTQASESAGRSIAKMAEDALTTIASEGLAFLGL